MLQDLSYTKPLHYLDPILMPIAFNTLVSFVKPTLLALSIADCQAFNLT